MLVDCSILFNEIALLRLRMRELYDQVDRFIVVEAEHTFSGHVKPLYLRSNASDLWDPDNKIVHVVLPSLPPLYDNSEKSRFWLEAYHRNAIMQGLLQCKLDRSDLVLISDVDEIPSRDAIKRFRDYGGPSQIVQFSQLFLKYHFDDDIEDGYNRKKWSGTVGVRYSIFGQATPQGVPRDLGCAGQILDRQLAKARGIHVLDNAGWHLSSFGGRKFREYKTSHYAHGVGQAPIFDSGAELTMQSGELEGIVGDDFGFKHKIEALERLLEWRLPETVRNSPFEFSRFFKEGSGND